MVNFKCHCKYCRVYNFLWLLDDEMIWVEIPKNGSAGLKSTRFGYVVKVDKNGLIPLDEDSRLKPLPRLNPARYKKGFFVLRDPVERFKSNFAYFFGNGGARAYLGHEWLMRNDLFVSKNFKDYKNLSHEDKLDLIFDNWELMANFEGVHHFNSQASFIPDEFDKLEQKMIFEMKHLSPIFGFEEKINVSNSTSIVLKPHQEYLVKEYYTEDYDLIRKYL